MKNKDTSKDLKRCTRCGNWIQTKKSKSDLCDSCQKDA